MKEFTVSENYTINEVMEAFEDNKDRVAIVISDDDKVAGVVSQGDIIRALVSGINTYTLVSQIIQPSFLYMNSKNYELAYPIFKEKKITLMPIIDDNYKLIDVITINDIFDYLEGIQ